MDEYFLTRLIEALLTPAPMATSGANAGCRFCD
jgi:hypothetical protein